MDELEKACEPLIAYIRKNYNPYIEIVVRDNSITVKQEIAGIPKWVTRQASHPVD